MIDKQIIIDDQKKTIHGLQDECTEKTNAIIALGEQLKRKEQECEDILEKNTALFKKALETRKECIALRDSFFQLQNELNIKKAECERLKWYLNEIRNEELKLMDIDWDEYETHCIDTEYTNIINLVEEALEERSPEDCRYGK